MINRAAQFSPFAALTGFDAAIIETGRLTDERIELGENAMDAPDLKMQILLVPRFSLAAIASHTNPMLKSSV